MAGPLGVLAAGPAAATIEVGDVDGGPPGGAGGRSGSSHHQSWRRRWWAPWGCWRQVRQWPPPVPIRDPRGAGAEGLGTPTINVKIIDDGPLVGARVGDPRAQCLWSPSLRQGGEWLQKLRDKC
jgi:hypothetical protein